MPGGVDFTINSNGLTARPQMPSLTSLRPITSDTNSTANSTSAAGADLMTKVVKGAFNGVGGNVDITV